MLTRTPVCRRILQSGQWEGLPEQCADSMPCHLRMCWCPSYGCLSKHWTVPGPLRVYSQVIWWAEFAARYVSYVLAVNMYLYVGWERNDHITTLTCCYEAGWLWQALWLCVCWLISVNWLMCWIVYGRSSHICEVISALCQGNFVVGS